MIRHTLHRASMVIMLLLVALFFTKLRRKLSDKIRHATIFVIHSDLYVGASTYTVSVERRPARTVRHLMLTAEAPSFNCGEYVTGGLYAQDERLLCQAAVPGQTTICIVPR